MRRGPWHQFGDRSQKLAQEQLGLGCGVGVIVSPRDIALDKATSYSTAYRAIGADVIVDQQFYNPSFTNDKLGSYSTSELRVSLGQLQGIPNAMFDRFSAGLEADSRKLNVTAILAPAVAYEAARPDLIDLNRKLFAAAKRVGNNLALPTYGTIIIGDSATGSDSITSGIIASATSLDADGWYYGFEFAADRIPGDRNMVYRCCATGLTLACTGKPLLHAFAGPMGILSLAFGSTGVGIGHSQNVWQFSPSRWDPPTGGGGGGGDAPPRYFSSALWGTIIYPDETIRLNTQILSQIITASPFCAPVQTGTAWNRWDANKHLVHVICSEVAAAAQTSDPRQIAAIVDQKLAHAVQLHGTIASAGINVRDGSNSYQQNWRSALNDIVAQRADDFDYLEML